MTTTSQNTLAHELIAKDEQIIGTFFSAFAIQYYLHKEILHEKMHVPNFIDFFTDIELYASQRVFIKNIILSPKYRLLCEELGYLFYEHDKNPAKRPYDLFLSRINKAFLIRQIFGHSDQILDKYKFLERVLDYELNNLNVDSLFDRMAYLPVEQQVLILARIFSLLKDNLDNKKRSIKESFVENMKKIKINFEEKGKSNLQEYKNIESWLNYYQIK